MLKRISERGHREGQRVRADDVRARAATAQADELEAYLEALPRGAESPFARLGALHIARVQLFRALVHQGPKQKHTDTLQHAHLVFTSTIDGDLDPYLDELARARARGRRVVGPLRRLPGARGPRRVPGVRARASRRRPGLFQSAMPRATVAEVREALALREQVIDFAVEAQGLDAAALQERFRATLLRCSAARRTSRAAAAGRRTSTSPTSRATSCAATRCRPRPTCCCGSSTSPQARRADDADAAAGGDGRAVDARRPATAMNVAFTFAGLRALGLPDDVLASFPDGVPRRDGGARRAARRPRALAPRRAWEFGTGAHVLVTRLRDRRRAPARGAGRRSSPPTPSGGVELVHLQRAEALAGGKRPLRVLRRDRPARGRGRRRRAAARRRPARRRGRLARRGDGRGAARLPRRGRHAAGGAARAVRPQRHVRRLPQAGDGRRPRSGASSPSQDAYPGGPEQLAAKIVGRWPDGTPLALSPDAPRRGRVLGDPRADQRLRLRGRPRRAEVPARRPHPPRQPARRRRLLRRPAHQPPPDRAPRPRLRHAAPAGRASRTTASTAAWSSSASRPTSGASSRPSRRSGSTTATRSGSAATRTSWSASRTAPRAR